MEDITSFSIPYNYVLCSAIIAWAGAQLCKTLINWIMYGKFDKERLFGAGGMPSSHSATVCSLAIAVGRCAGISSIEFAISIVLAAIVMYDATGVRRSSGEHAKILNRVIETLDLPKPKQAEIKRKLHIFNRASDSFDETEDDEEMKKLKEKLGHTPLEALGGALFGIVVALLVPMA